MGYRQPCKRGQMKPWRSDRPAERGPRAASVGLRGRTDTARGWACRTRRGRGVCEITCRARASICWFRAIARLNPRHTYFQRSPGRILSSRCSLYERKESLYFEKISMSLILKSYGSSSVFAEPTANSRSIPKIVERVFLPHTLTTEPKTGKKIGQKRRTC